MNARQAYLELLNGNRIRRHWYRDGVFIKMTEDGRVEDSTEKQHTLIVADDYEIYTEPKRKVRYAPNYKSIAPFRKTCGDCDYCFFEDGEHFCNRYKFVLSGSINSAELDYMTCDGWNG